MVSLFTILLTSLLSGFVESALIMVASWRGSALTDGRNGRSNGAYPQHRVTLTGQLVCMSLVAADKESVLESEGYISSMYIYISV